ncbi:unnamed protein product [Effrenium voratum]|nr:unnamed protein product [Effrenium voratum]
MAANARLSPRTQYDSEWECNSEEAGLAEPFAPADEEHAPADVAGGPGLRPSGPSSPSGGHSAQSLKFTGKQLFIATAPQDGRGACFASAVAAAVAATTCQARSGSEPSRSGRESSVCGAGSQSPKVQSSTCCPSAGEGPLGHAKAGDDCFYTPRASPRMRCASPEWTPAGAASKQEVRQRTGHGASLSGNPADGSLLVWRPNECAGCFGCWHLIACVAVVTMLDEADEADEAWCGWQLHATPAGCFYYFHASGMTQWEMPRELVGVLGEWQQVGADGDPYWFNERLGASCWRDPHKCSSIHEAALDGNLAYIHLFLFAGGCLNAVNAKGRSALHNACAAGQTEVIALLLANKVDVHLVDHSISSPLHWACRYGHSSAVQLLLQARADPNASNMLGDSPTHEAAGLGQVSALQQLLVAKADLFQRNAEARTPSQVAAVRGRVEAQAVLDAACEQEEEPAQRPNNVLQEPLSPALKLVRAARPVLRGVQWLANRVLGECQRSESQARPWLESDDDVFHSDSSEDEIQFGL